MSKEIKCNEKCEYYTDEACYDLGGGNESKPWRECTRFNKRIIEIEEGDGCPLLTLYYDNEPEMEIEDYKQLVALLLMEVKK